MKFLNQTRGLNITGCFLSYREGQPVLIRCEGKCFLPIYSTVEKLEASMEFMKVPDYKIKHIDDGLDFIKSLEGQVVVALDPHVVNGNTRFTGVFSPEQAAEWN